MIKVLKALYSILSTNSAVTSLVGTKIFPNVVPDKDSAGAAIAYPLIVMRRTSLIPEYSKSSECKVDTSVVDILCYSTSYSQVIDIAEAVRSAIEFYKGTKDGILFTNSRILNITEDYIESVYYQQITFSFK